MGVITPERLVIFGDGEEIKPESNPEVKGVSKKVVPQKWRVDNRNAIPRNIFGQPYGGRIRVPLNYRAQVK